MTRRWWLLAISVFALATLVAGCDLLREVIDDDGSTQRQRVIVENWASQNLSRDQFPLYVGAKWTYRNATPDINPEIHAGFPIVREIVAMVQCFDPSTNLAHDCYVLRISRMGNTVGHLYLHRSLEGIQLFAIERFPQTGTPNLVPGDARFFLKLPLQKGDEIQFALEEGSRYDMRVRDQERIPLGSMIELGPYTEGFVDAFRVQAEYGGVFQEILARGVEDTWYAQGVGLTRVSANSQFYELMEFRSWEEIVTMDESHAGRQTYFPPVGSVLEISLRDEEGTRHNPAWQLCNRSEVEENAVFSILSGFNDIEARHCDVGYSEPQGPKTDETPCFTRLDTGTSVFAFEVRTNGRQHVVFENRITGERLTYRFGAEQDPVLSEPDVEVNIGASSVTLSVRYMDPDGDRPGTSDVCIDQGEDAERTERMIFSHGKRADGYYVASGIELERGTHTYCFKFDDSPSNDQEMIQPDDLPCQLPGIFDIGGTSP